MKTTIQIKTILFYLAAPLIVCSVLLNEKGSFILIGMIQFCLGAIQLLIAAVKTVTQLINKNVAQQLKKYWLLVLVYFGVAAIGAIFEDILGNGDTKTTIAIVYFSLAWVIAMYHFKHIFMLPFKNTANTNA